MFSFTKKKIHEPESAQLEEVANTPFGILCTSGLNCDKLPQAQGEFGISANNPIPVNGRLGTFKYLNKLYVTEGPLFYHRLGSLASDVTEYPIDAYEVVSWNGKWWDILFFDIYHPRRSNLAPEHYSLRSYKNNPLGDIAYGFGVDTYCHDFPFDLPAAVELITGIPAFGRRAKENIEKNSYTRPEIHKTKLGLVDRQLHKRKINYSILAQNVSSQLIGMTDEATPNFYQALIDGGSHEMGNHEGLEIALFTEVIIFGLHLLDRIAFHKLGATQRAAFMDALLPVVQQELHPSVRTQLAGLYNTRNEFYGRFAKLYPDKGTSAKKDTLFWEFGKALGSVYAANNPARIMDAAMFGMTIYEVLLKADFFNVGH